MTMTDTAPTVEHCFKLKGGSVTMTILELHDYDYERFTQQLAELTGSAPDFFQQTPVILSLEQYHGKGYLDFIEIGELCKEHGMVPVAVRGANEDQLMSANVAGLPPLPTSRITSEQIQLPEQAPQEPPVVMPAAPQDNLLVTTPIRSGQQIYAEHGDLIIVSSVGAGAEVMASGNIHVYGPLRGRALAGINGDTSARIFCRSLEAELISIAGTYLVNEDLRGENWKAATQTVLQDERLLIEKLK